MSVYMSFRDRAARTNALFLPVPGDSSVPNRKRARMVGPYVEDRQHRPLERPQVAVPRTGTERSPLLPDDQPLVFVRTMIVFRPLHQASDYLKPHVQHLHPILFLRSLPTDNHLRARVFRFARAAPHHTAKSLRTTHHYPRRRAI